VNIKNEKEPPVFAVPEGYGYPSEADAYIYPKSAELWSSININN